MTAVPDPTVTDRAVEAAARADHAWITETGSWENETEASRDTYRECARVVLAAAVPVLLEALADEIREYDDKPLASVDHIDGWQTGLADAIDIVRSAAGRWSSDG